jgi:kynurenine 3-monooxygenase
MVTFSPDIPYADAQKGGQHHDAIMNRVMQTPGIEEKWNSPEVEDLILRSL